MLFSIAFVIRTAYNVIRILFVPIEKRKRVNAFMLFSNIDLSEFKALSKLPLYHTLRYESVFNSGKTDQDNSMVDFTKNVITANQALKCEIFKESLIYVFYGRPAFHWVDLPPFPVCFQFMSDVPVDPVRIYPFDSGALYYGYYCSAYKQLNGENLHDYQLKEKENGIACDDIPRLVNAIWTTNENYCNGIVPGDLRLLERYTRFLSNCDIDYLHFIYYGKGIDGKYGKADERAFTIEYQLTQDLSLRHLSHITFPPCTPIEKALSIKRHLKKELGISVKFLILEKSCSPSDVFSHIDKYYLGTCLSTSAN